MKPPPGARRRRPSVLVMPLVLAVLSLVGLVVGLLGDGLIDLAGWLALGIPVAAIGWALATRRA